jgi:uncharacterized protein YqfA (UPF0365 family)
MDGASFLIGLAVGVVVTLMLVIWLVINRAWRHATLSYAHIPWTAILGMRLRGTPPTLIADAFVALRKRGKNVDVSVVEAAYLTEAGRQITAHELVAIVEKHLPEDAA